MKNLFGMFRALVVNNKDPEKFGRILVWIPDLMPEVSKNKGIWARPANNQIGGRNIENDSAHHFAGSSYIPLKGSWTFCFFECGNINRPYYFGALDLENTKVLPENQSGKNYENKWTILKTHAGRVIHISDDPDDERIEIGGKKRQLKNPPTGDIESVFKIDDNMTTILFDEREGKEKILIRTHKGDFLHIDIDEQKLQCYFKSDINIHTGNNLNIKVDNDIHIKCDNDIFIESANNMNIKAANNINEQAGNDKNLQASGNINTDGAIRNDQSGASASAINANPILPEGERNT